MADLSSLSFIQERLAEADSTLETRKGTAFYDLFIKPQEFMLQPLITGMETVLTAQSVRRVLQLTDPDSFDTALVDDLASNVFVDRNQGDFATSTVRVLYQNPVDREFAAFSAEFDSGSLAFFNSRDVVITSGQMALQTQGNFFYLDFPIRAQLQGTSYNITVDQGITFINDSAAVSSFLLSDAEGGLAIETNTQVLNRARTSIGVRDLETVKGINAIIQENFNFVSEIQAIGMGDPEMQRDILFNAHVGGKTDIYLKTPAFQTKSANFVGLDFDFTREVPYNVHMQISATSTADPASQLGVSHVVTETVSVISDTIPTAARFVTAHIPAITGINLTAKEYIKLQVDGRAAVNIKVSGATPSQTQRFEIINSINATVGVIVAFEFATDQIAIQSPKIGSGSQLILTTPDTPRSDGTTTLIPSAAAAGYVANTTPGTYVGIAPTVYVENVDYQVFYPDGKITNLGGAILSGRVVAAEPAAPASGLGRVTAHSTTFASLTAGAFTSVQPGDLLTIITSSAVTLGTYVVQSKTDNTHLVILGMDPSGTDNAITYSIVSQQVVVVDLKYNPISIDIGPHVLLSDGVTRGIRPGRDSFTIKDVAYVDTLSVQEIDPITLQGIGTFLKQPGGFGSGGFGGGGFGFGSAGDFRFIVNSPTERFSAFEDSVLVFNQDFFGQSVSVTYFSATEIDEINTFCRADGERVTGADVLPKTLMPGLVDMTIHVRPNPTNVNTPTNAALALLIENYIKSIRANNPVEQSVIAQLIIDAGLASVQTPFLMTATVLNPDGSTTVLQSEDQLEFPPVTLASQTSNFTTARIMQWYPNSIVITGV